MDFVMDGTKLGVPYHGAKIIQGFLKKETKSFGIMLKRVWQQKYCSIDLTRFLFKYAKSPTDPYRFIFL